MALFPKQPKLQKTGTYDPVELENYISDVMDTTLFCALITITVLTGGLIYTAHRLGEEEEKNKK